MTNAEIRCRKQRLGHDLGNRLLSCLREETRTLYTDEAEEIKIGNASKLFVEVLGYKCEDCVLCQHGGMSISKLGTA